MFDRRNVRRDTDIGVWARRWSHLGRRCRDTLKDVFECDMTIERPAREVDYFCRSLYLPSNVDVAFENCGLNLCCFENPVNGFYLFNNASTWRRKLKFGRQQPHHLRIPQFVEWHRLDTFAFPSRERNDFFLLVPYG